ncbi:jg20903 [Pararge aegeria aegeria]|uniref:Jg20903 protein n=1 Tax=Pararge aegeria aegeria TaxID=348720 RepID=A0A8S4RHF4_9NEOP|nr:jg20903 [Pararge aegeria aegeria]
MKSALRRQPTACHQLDCQLTDHSELPQALMGFRLWEVRCGNATAYAGNKFTFSAALPMKLEILKLKRYDFARTSWASMRTTR